ncbi:hypothetical protein U3A55_00835 [Salarchaeum sp. III]
MSGTLVSLDRDATRRRSSFVTEAMAILQSTPAKYQAAAVDD